MSASAISSLSVSLPESLRRSIETLAKREGISVEQFIANAAAEKLAAWQGLEHLRREAARGRREDLEYFLAAVPDVEPPASDRLPEEDRNA